MVSYAKDFGVTSDHPNGNPGIYISPLENSLTLLTRILGVCSAVVVSGVGADVAYHQHVMGYYVTVASAMIFFFEITWAITLFVQICLRNDESHCWQCWSSVLMLTKGWRRSLFYLPLSCILIWKPHNLWLSFVAAGLLAILSLLHIISSVLNKKNRSGGDTLGESLLHTRPEHYDRFEEVLVTDVFDDIAGGPMGRMVDSDVEI